MLIERDFECAFVARKYDNLIDVVQLLNEAGVSLVGPYHGD